MVEIFMLSVVLLLVIIVAAYVFFFCTTATTRVLNLATEDYLNVASTGIYYYNIDWIIVCFHQK